MNAKNIITNFNALTDTENAQNQTKNDETKQITAISYDLKNVVSKFENILFGKKKSNATLY